MLKKPRSFFFSRLFKGILQTHGPLPIDDLNITSQFAEFPPETMQIIESEGGIGSFLKKSITFTMVSLCLNSNREKMYASHVDLPKCSRASAPVRKSTYLDSQH